jgi:hypothetical protein
MSEDKKTWGKAYDTNAPRELTPGAPGQPGQQISAAPLEGATGGASEACASPEAPARAISTCFPEFSAPKYGELLNAPVPDAITELIKKLESKEAALLAPKRPREEESGQ